MSEVHNSLPCVAHHVTDILYQEATFKFPPRFPLPSERIKETLIYSSSISGNWLRLWNTKISAGSVDVHFLFQSRLRPRSSMASFEDPENAPPYQEPHASLEINDS
jgi:hypothetical protein